MQSIVISITRRKKSETNVYKMSKWALIALTSKSRVPYQSCLSKIIDWEKQELLTLLSGLNRLLRTEQRKQTH